MFSSNTPLLILSSILSINAFSSKTFPAPNMSSNVILNASVTDAPPPMWPFANGNKLADVTFLTCVAGDKTVLPNCVATFNCSIALYALLCISSSNLPGVPLNACTMSFDACSFDSLDDKKPSPGTLPIFCESNIPLTFALASSLNNHPSLIPNAAIRSISFLFVVCVIACEAVVNTDAFKLFSSPNNFLIASGNSSPVFIISFNLNCFLDTVFKNSNGSPLLVLPSLNIFLTNCSALFLILTSGLKDLNAGSSIAAFLKSLLFFTRLTI